MKKYSIFIIISSLLITTISFSQEMTKRNMPKSPEAAFTQQFGESQIMLSYARPMVRGRKIFGGLVPFDSLWRTGAGDCTTLELKDFVYIGNKKIEAGKYSLFAIPTITDWTIILNSETFMHGTMGYKIEKDIHRFKVKSIKSERFYETFTIEINDFTDKGDASLNLIWENTMVKIPLKHEPDEVFSQNPVTTIIPNPMPNTPTNDSHLGHNHATEPTTTLKEIPSIKAQFSPILKAYFAMKDALVADNSKLAAEKAKALKKALNNLEMESWTDKQKSVYKPLSKILLTETEHIADNAKNIAHQREYFINLSDNMTTIVKTLKINPDTTYLQFCPMANDGKGAFWLSEENKVKNPYYGKQMLTCGSVKETLK